MGENLQIDDSDAFGSGRRLIVTILGKTGSGKTVFLSSLYSQLAEGVSGFRAAASNDKTDRILGGAIETLYEQEEPPPGTTENELHYAFSLMFDGEPVAEIDCFDYRGGATDDDADQTDAGAILKKRIASSDIVMWLIDLSEAADRGASLYDRRARLHTKLRRLQSICSQAIKSEPRLRVWSFVRTKVDKSFPNLSEDDLRQATHELHKHLGDVVTVATYGNVPYANLVSIAPIGKATVCDGKIQAGDEAINVQWPLLTSISMLIKSRLATLDEKIEAYQSSERDANSKTSFFSRTRASSENRSLAPPDEEKEREFLSAILARVSENVPKSIMILDRPGQDGEPIDG